MRILLAIFCLCLLGITQETVVPHLGPLKARDVPRFVFNLDLPAKERWAEIADAYKYKLQTVIGVAQILINMMPNAEHWLKIIGRWGKTFYKH
mmetsp:Transcript_45360/g.63073  ORF Transcript_45360/g.63073 Transcript_45360/m.63073 type:complete len:93 (-) Transcript_45360:306-584(-)